MRISIIFKAWQLREYFKYHKENISMVEFHNCMKTLRQIENNIKNFNQERNYSNGKHPTTRAS